MYNSMKVTCNKQKQGSDHMGLGNEADNLHKGMLGNL